ncbi:hypothetical protein BU204_24050 [Actinophytocola xanthii]|uniref:Teneurin-like YD-shell domain-containing protein n=2 Tax=Actinophytocola xanthii TaxID=1912961 RepID=A0A1Q8CKU1_9PSEU|nr:hypothetical protein BU204_24050 [Actinophytocola xanthii]
MAVVLAATVIPAVAAPVAASARSGPSVDLPAVTAPPVSRDTTRTRPEDDASKASMTGDRDPRGIADGGGTYSATSLSPSATWEVAAQSGDFNWTYPLRMPPAAGGLVPDLSLSYRSSAVDGRTSAVNQQASWVGDGWDLSAGFIERSYGPCYTDTEGGVAPPPNGDLCWRTDNATAAFGAAGGRLLCCDGQGRWRPEAEDGSRVERFATGLANGDNDGEHWRITTTDGTEYWFGSQPDAGSTWTVPVFGDDPNEPCHVSGGFESSHCAQAWRWNLDKIVDRNGNVVRFRYAPEQNRYGMNAKDAAVPYVRGGTLAGIDYGLHTTASSSPTARVRFDIADRCLPGSDCTRAKPGNWPDVPLDLSCETATCPGRHRPSFWSSKRLSTITTEVRSGTGYAAVDRWTLDQIHPDPGDGEQPALWLKSIRHTGLVGGSAELPLVTFEGTRFANRVATPQDGYAKLNRYRITGVVTESGGWLGVNYRRPDCTPATVADTPKDANTLLCYPATWAKKDNAERTDHFHKYVVESVVQSDQMSTSTQQVTSYEYLGGAAWHRNTSEFVKDDKKGWDEFRGFARVRTKTGVAEDDAGPVTMTERRFYRGMHGDRMLVGTRTVHALDSHDGSERDEDWLRGFEFEETTYDGVDGAAVSTTITRPTTHGPFLTQGPYRSYLVLPGREVRHTALAAGGWRTTTSVTTHTDHGLPLTVSDLGVAGAADDRCTTTTYATIPGRWILDRPGTTRTVAVACGDTPTFPRDAVSAAATTYDGNGNPTADKAATSWTAPEPTWATTATLAHDVHGRVVSTTNALDRTTTTEFTPRTGGPVTAQTVTSPPTDAVPAGLRTTTEYSPAWGQPTVVTDQNGRRTEAHYDPLGRRTAVWLPNNPRPDNPVDPNYRFAYHLHRDRPNLVTAAAQGPNGRTTTSHTVYDGFLRPRQTQSPAVGGGRLLTDTRYDSQGRVWKQTQPYFNEGPLDGVLWVAADAEVPGLTRTRYDGAGREVRSVYQSGVEDRWATTTSYGGDRTHVTPPAGGTATTTVTDARGRVTEVRQYRTGRPDGEFDATRYRYTHADRLAEVTGPDGAVWRYTHDLRGRVTSRSDPDSGTSTVTYDELSRPVLTEDARGEKVATVYDALGRPLSTHRGSAAGPLLTRRTYDTAPGGKGRPASATSVVDGAEYRWSVGAYTALDKPSNTTITVPAAEGTLAGTYTSATGYGADGSVTGQTYAKTGDLHEETVNHGFDDSGRPLTTTGDGAATPLVSETLYTRYGEVARVQLGAGPGRAWLTYLYESDTRRLSRYIVDAEVAKPMQADIRYTTDPAGNITSVADRTLGRTADVQCFRYDHLRRLTDAWTPPESCAAAPNADRLDGPAPYWHSYAYDPGGNRREEVRHSAGTERAYTYPAPGQAQPHTVRSVSGGGHTASYAYDAAGNTTERTLDGVTEKLDWDATGRLESMTGDGGSTRFVHGPDGERLLRKDPAGTTLYLPGQEIRVAAGSTTRVTTRYYSHAGMPVAVRTGGRLTWFANDRQGSPMVAVDAATMSVTQRRQLPFGGARGTRSAWPGERGFVGGTEDPRTGLVHLGAREYDPDLGRFISRDPVIDWGNPQQASGYAYGDNSPVTLSDPDGLCPGPDGIGCGHKVSKHGYGDLRDPANMARWKGDRARWKDNAREANKRYSWVRNNDGARCADGVTFCPRVRGHEDQYAYARARHRSEQLTLALEQNAGPQPRDVINQVQQKLTDVIYKQLLHVASTDWAEFRSVSLCGQTSAGFIVNLDTEVCVTADVSGIDSSSGISFNQSSKLSLEVGGGFSAGVAVKLGSESAAKHNETFSPTLAAGLEAKLPEGGIGVEYEWETGGPNSSVNASYGYGLDTTIGGKWTFLGLTRNYGVKPWNTFF